MCVGSANQMGRVHRLPPRGPRHGHADRWIYGCLDRSDKLAHEISANGTFETCRDVRFLIAIGGKADIAKR